MTSSEAYTVILHFKIWRVQTTMEDWGRQNDVVTVLGKLAVGVCVGYMHRSMAGFF